MLPVLGSSTVVNIVGVCDSILYKAISGVLMPTVLQALPDRWVHFLSPLLRVGPQYFSFLLLLFLNLIAYCLGASLAKTINVGLLKIKFYIFEYK